MYHSGMCSDQTEKQSAEKHIAKLEAQVAMHKARLALYKRMTELAIVQLSSPETKSATWWWLHLEEQAHEEISNEQDTG